MLFQQCCRLTGNHSNRCNKCQYICWATCYIFLVIEYVEVKWIWFFATLQLNLAIRVILIAPHYTWLRNPGDTWREKELLVWFTLNYVDHTLAPLLHTSGSRRSSRLMKSRNMSAAYKAYDSSRRTKISEASRDPVLVFREVWIVD